MISKFQVWLIPVARHLSVGGTTLKKELLTLRNDIEACRAFDVLLQDLETIENTLRKDLSPYIQAVALKASEVSLPPVWSTQWPRESGWYPVWDPRSPYVDKSRIAVVQQVFPGTCTVRIEGEAIPWESILGLLWMPAIPRPTHPAMDTK